MTLIRGVWGAVDDVGVPYRNDIEDIRAAIWDTNGQRQGVIRGLDMSLDAGSLSVTFSPGSAVIEERGTDITGNGRGYHASTDVNVVVPFVAPSAASRSDAVVVAWADPQYGVLGASVDGPGPQIVVVAGVSGSVVPRTDTQINTEIGPGGWFRYMDVIIANGDTQVNPANVTQVARVGVPRCRVTRVPGLFSPGGANTAIPFNTVVVDTHQMLSGGNVVIPAGVAGYYLLSAGTGWDGVAADRSIAIVIRVNNIAVVGSTGGKVASTSDLLMNTSCSTALFLDEGDVVSVAVHTTEPAGGAVTATSSDSSLIPFLSVIGLA